MAAPTFQAAGTFNFDSGGSPIATNWPAHAANDIAILYVWTTVGFTPTLTTANGFVQLATFANATERLTLFWCRATSSSQLNPQLALTADRKSIGGILTFRGAVTTGDPWNVVSAGQAKNVASTSASITGVTTLYPNSLAVYSLAWGVGNAGPMYSAEADSALGSLTERQDIGHAYSTGGGFAVWTGVKAAAGDTGTLTATISNSTTEAYLVFALTGDGEQTPHPVSSQGFGSDVPFIVANDRYATVVLADPGGSTTTAEFRHFFAAAPLWDADLTSTTQVPVYFLNDELFNYVPGTVELPFIWSKGVSEELQIDGVYIEFNTKPASVGLGLPTTYTLGYSGYVEAVGISGYSRTISGSQTSGVHTSTTFAYSSTVGVMAGQPWPNMHAQYHPLHMDQTCRAARVVLTDVHLVEIERVQLIGKHRPGRIV